MKKLALVAAALFVVSVFAGDFKISELNLNHADGIYKLGEEIVVGGTLLLGGNPAPDYKLRVITRWESIKVVGSQDFPCDGTPFRVTYKGEQPGWVYFAFHVIGPEGNIVLNPSPKNPQGKNRQVDEIGVMIAPEELRYPQPIPEDFDEFWKNERAKLDNVPMNPRLEKIESGRKGIDLYTVKIDAGVSQPATGYLAIPAGAKEKAFPIYLTFLSAVPGDANRREALDMAARGCVAMTATWHGFDVNRDNKYYTENCGKINSFATAGSRDTFFTREIYVRALRAADYLKSRPEWNGKDFLVGGGSLAGSQAAAVAALDKQVTIAFVHTPGQSYNADLAGRQRSTFQGVPAEKMTTAIRRALSYFDIVSMASRITCEVFFATGFADENCTPSNVFCAYNNVPTGIKKVITTNPHTGHYGTTVDTRAQKRMNSFFSDYWKLHGGF